jgi:hypothetical protein
MATLRDGIEDFVPGPTVRPSPWADPTKSSRPTTPHAGERAGETCHLSSRPHRRSPCAATPTNSARAPLRQQIVKLKELRDRDKVEITQLRADQEALVRVVHQLTVQNQ